MNVMAKEVKVMSIYTKDFWRDLGERVVATFGQVGAGALVAAVGAGQGLFDLDWQAAASIVGIAVLLAIFKGLAAVSANPDTGASFGTTVPKSRVAAVEEERAGEYVAEEASPFPTGTPVDVVPEDNGHDAPAYDGDEPDYPAEIDASLEEDEHLQR